MQVWCDMTTAGGGWTYAVNDTEAQTNKFKALTGGQGYNFTCVHNSIKPFFISPTDMRCANTAHPLPQYHLDCINKWIATINTTGLLFWYIDFAGRVIYNNGISNDNSCYLPHIDCAPGQWSYCNAYYRCY